MAGENPMRWDCEKDGCFNKKKRPKIELFAQALPGKIAMSDVDGMVEVNGHFLFLEWKSRQGGIPTGQAIAYKRLTGVGDYRQTLFVLAGDAETMRIDALKRFVNGRERGWEKANFDEVLVIIRRWAKFVRRRPRPAAIPSTLTLWYRERHSPEWQPIGTRATQRELLDIMEWSGLDEGTWLISPSVHSPERLIAKERK